MAYDLNWTTNGVDVLFCDTLTDNDFIEANSEIFSSNKLRTIKYQNCDFSQVDDIDVNPEVMRILATIDSQSVMINPNIRISVIATDPNAIKLIDMYQQFSYGSPWKLKIFENRQLSTQWINEAI